MSTAMMDYMTFPMNDSKRKGLYFRGSIFVPCLCNAVMLADFPADGI